MGSRLVLINLGRSIELSKFVWVEPAASFAMSVPWTKNGILSCVYGIKRGLGKYSMLVSQRYSVNLNGLSSVNLNYAKLCPRGIVRKFMA